MNAIFRKIFSKQIAKLTGGGIGAVLAAIGGITSVGFLQPAVEKTSDAAAKTVALYCELPLVDRERFASEIMERLAARAVALNTATATVRVTCPVDTER